MKLPAMLPMRSLRFRLILAFVLVSVPPMLAATYIGARLISDAFEANVEQWLEETSRFFAYGVTDTENEAERASKVVAARLEKLDIAAEGGKAALKDDFDLLQAVGYDVIQIYDEAHTTLYANRGFESLSPLPTSAKRGIFEINMSGERLLLAGAVSATRSGGKPAFLLLGSRLDQTYLNNIKVVTSLEVRLFRRTARGLEAFAAPVATTQTSIPPSAILAGHIKSKLDAGEDIVFDQTVVDETYRAVYAALRGIDGQLAGVVFIGLETSESFFEQIGQWQLFSGIFIMGSLISVLTGLWMSGLLVRPLRALTRGVRAITSGDYESRVDEEGSQEFQELAAGFNGMAVQLRTLRGLEEELRRRDRLTALGEAAMVIAHEVRNPLGIIKTSTEVVRKRTMLAAADDKLLGYVVDEVRRIERLIREFLDFARPKSPAKVPIRLRALAERVTAGAAVELQKNHVQLSIAETTPEVDALVDIDQLHQALLNLVLNALDAMPGGGGITITISATETEAAITVSDTGTGIEADVAEKIFNPFFTTKAKGTGLGLAKVQHVAEAHGGAASCVSAPGKGASFTIRLPRLTVDPARDLLPAMVH